MEVSTLILQRLKDLGLEQKDLADAAGVTESYISQLLRRKKLPPAAGRTNLYDKLGKFLKLPPGELAKLAEYQRKVELKKKIEDPPAPLFTEVRHLILQKCKTGRREQVAAIFEKQPFGELERLVIQKLVEVVKTLAADLTQREDWLRLFAKVSGQSYKTVRLAVSEFLESELLSIPSTSFVAILDPLIVSWDIDLSNFGLEFTLNRQLAPTSIKAFEFVEKKVTPTEQPGLRAFRKDSALSGDATEDELRVLERLHFDDKRQPTALYYYRELQSLRDPLHFRSK